jgi:hypothetical protein
VLTNSVTGRFSGARGGAQEQKNFETLDKLTMENKGESVRKKRQAEQIYNEVKDLTPERRREYIQDKLQRKEIDEETIKKLEDVIVEKVQNLSSFEKYFKEGPTNKVKAQFIVSKLSTLPPEERKEYFLSLYNKKLITKDIMKEISKEIKRQAQ